MTTRATRSARSVGLLTALLLAALPAHVSAQTPATPPGASERIEQLPPVVVIDSTPVPGLGIPVEKYPGNVQSVPSGDIDNRNRLDVSDTLFRGLGSVNVNALDNLWIGADVVSVTGNYLRGDDGNQQAKVSGYTLLSLHVRYAPIKQLEIWGRVDNVTSAHYATAGAVNWNAFADPISVQRFVAPGPPIAGWAGVKLRF